MAEGGETGKLGVEEQKLFVSNQLQRPLVKGEIWYMIDAKWLKQWKSYVGYESWDHYNVGEESANPGPIDNVPLFEEEGGKLKEHLIDDLDYALVPAEAWEKLFGWYGMVEEQQPLSRKVIEEGVYSKSLKVEVYPWHLKICDNSKPDEQISKQFSRADTIEQLEKAMRKEFNISDEKEVRLWNRYLTNMYQPLKNKENTLQDAGLYQGQVIVIEQKNEDGTWPRQTSATKSTAATGTSVSTRSGNSYGSSSGSNWNNYGYSDQGRVGSITPGLCGLSNIGNTCFMNSALQCMSNVPRLTEYFLSDRWSGEVNEDNPLGMNGEIARTYAELVQVMWSGKYSYTVPRNFKVSVGRFAPQFSGYQQQDSQELMAFLLDGLHEDLNRIKKKPYIEQKDAEDRSDQDVAGEAWENYKKRNDSIIVDIFHGLLKSTVQCPECDKISVTFDPFCYLSLPLPVKKERQLEVFWVPQDPARKTEQLKLTVPKMGCVFDLCEVLSSFVGVSKDYMVVTDVYNHRFHKMFGMNESLSTIMDRDDIFVYQVPVTSHDDSETVVLPVYMREERARSSYNQTYMGTYQLFGQPILLSVPRQNCTYQKLYDIVLQRLARSVTVPADNEKWWITEDSNDLDLSSDDHEENNSPSISNHGDGTATTTCNGTSSTKDSSDDSGMEVSNGESTTSDDTPDSETSSTAKLNNINNAQTNIENGSEELLEKAPKLFRFSVVNSYGSAELDYKLKDDGKPLRLNSRMYISVDWNSMAKEKFYNDNEADAYEAHETMKNKPPKRQVIQLSDCLDLFTTTEKLGENDPWYCPQCKKHQQATKKFDLWSLPDTLIIHMKRFSYSRYWRDKIDAMVEFPTKDLDLSKFVIDPTNKVPYVYDLIGVSNHYGGLGGGHYTACCLNVKEDDWYYFDDASVSRKSAEESVSKAGYVLVYQKRGTLRQPAEKPPAPATITSEDMNGLEKSTEEMDTN